ncbi:unnamed protein product [Tuber melanosporum]|uniref:(Perigord truffle) hypothetical protein n=1 Tax=Tuber melanosporum (strain Mel28) TaxID=656061 RepID=D5GL41_TUBMM|nr:uncharacterized protein GSTUM_00009962001 [Tuber melanosporum]CAZ85234.1 unnamed protein product [Tuber melanosporum]
MEKGEEEVEAEEAGISDQSVNESVTTTTSLFPNPETQFLNRSIRSPPMGRKEGKYPPIHRTDPKKGKIRKADPEHELFFFLLLSFWEMTREKGTRSDPECIWGFRNSRSLGRSVVTAMSWS